ncbi:hypothetical protein [Roseiconus lacunae]|uniref:hypothetical protein n=1 Tax=Roseiconus lacunae TaxID=2605694 RepID=UPI0011F1DE1B|nr:hypothetical protein [Roseiconus lacunae]MCD0457984.1 hypothetical protein [Roseiconus lacunae]WRQ48381.1 hypothetical protein U8335_15520 [Stieleria sp. HD01]
MSLIAGYMKDKGTGIGGGYEIRTVPFLKMIGLTPSNGKFIIQGTQKQIKGWLGEHGNLVVKTDEHFDTFHVTVGKLSSSNAAKIYLEEFFKGFVPNGGAIARVASFFRKDNWALILRIGAINARIPHKTFPTNTRVSEVVSAGRGLKLASDVDAVGVVGDALDAASLLG